MMIIEKKFVLRELSENILLKEKVINSLLPKKLEYNAEVA